METGATFNHFERGARVMVRQGWYEEGKRGTCLGLSLLVDQWWTPILWDGDEDPDFFKSVGLTLAPGKD